jgi:hypothetical protein
VSCWRPRCTAVVEGEAWKCPPGRASVAALPLLAAATAEVPTVPVDIGPTGPIYAWARAGLGWDRGPSI